MIISLSSNVSTTNFNQWKRIFFFFIIRDVRTSTYRPLSYPFRSLYAISMIFGIVLNEGKIIYLLFTYLCIPYLIWKLFGQPIKMTFWAHAKILNYLAFTLKQYASESTIIFSSYSSHSYWRSFSIGKYIRQPLILIDFNIQYLLFRLIEGFYIKYNLWIWALEVVKHNVQK